MFSDIKAKHAFILNQSKVKCITNSVIILCIDFVDSLYLTPMHDLA